MSHLLFEKEYLTKEEFEEIMKAGSDAENIITKIHREYTEELAKIEDRQSRSLSQEKRKKKEQMQIDIPPKSTVQSLTKKLIQSRLLGGGGKDDNTSSPHGNEMINPNKKRSK